MSWGQRSQHTWCDGCWGRAGVWLGTGSPSPAQRGPRETIGVSGTGKGQEESGLPCQRAFLWMFLLCWFGTRPGPAQLWPLWLSGPAALSSWQLSAPCAPLAASSTGNHSCLPGWQRSEPSQCSSFGRTCLNLLKVEQARLVEEQDKAGKEMLSARP